MLQIAICDDDRCFAQKLAALLEGCAAGAEEEFNVAVFTDAPAFLSSAVETYDAAFLDVRMGDVNGMEVARDLKRRNAKAVLIFVSAYLEFACKGYELDAFRYLLKEDLIKDFPVCMRDLLKKLDAQRQTFCFSTTDGKSIRLPLMEIDYIESQDHNVLVHARQADYNVHETFSAFTAQISSADFMLVQRSFFVNMRNVTSIKHYTLEVRDGTAISISRKSKAAVMKRFLMIQGEC